MYDLHNDTPTYATRHLTLTEIEQRAHEARSRAAFGLIRALRRRLGGRA
ncbi:hypothetical protein [Roseobacter sp. HKCCA0434]|nr:hypothetical protein [Roseobacter sp. HKCCA0434]